MGTLRINLFCAAHIYVLSNLELGKDIEQSKLKQQFKVIPNLFKKEFLTLVFNHRTFTTDPRVL